MATVLLFVEGCDPGRYSSVGTVGIPSWSSLTCRGRLHGLVWSGLVRKGPSEMVMIKMASAAEVALTSQQPVVDSDFGFGASSVIHPAIESHLKQHEPVSSQSSSLPAIAPLPTGCYPRPIYVYERPREHLDTERDRLGPLPSYLLLFSAACSTLTGPGEVRRCWELGRPAIHCSCILPPTPPTQLGSLPPFILNHRRSHRRTHPPPVFSYHWDSCRCSALLCSASPFAAVSLILPLRSCCPRWFRAGGCDLFFWAGVYRRGCAFPRAFFLRPKTIF